MHDIQFPKPQVHLFVCINERNTEMASCGPRITAEDVREVKKWIVSQGWATKVYCTKAKCLGFCDPEGSVACVYPSGRFIAGIQTAEDLKKIVMEELDGN